MQGRSELQYGSSMRCDGRLLEIIDETLDCVSRRSCEYSSLESCIEHACTSLAL